MKINVSLCLMLVFIFANYASATEVVDENINKLKEFFGTQSKCTGTDAMPEADPVSITSKLQFKVVNGDFVALYAEDEPANAAPNSAAPFASTTFFSFDTATGAFQKREVDNSNGFEILTAVPADVKLQSTGKIDSLTFKGTISLAGFVHAVECTFTKAGDHGFTMVESVGFEAHNMFTTGTLSCSQ